MADRAAAGGYGPAALTRAGWAGRYPSRGYLFACYGGLYPAGYSLLAPYLLAAFGTRASMTGATAVSWRLWPVPRDGCVCPHKSTNGDRNP